MYKFLSLSSTTVLSTTHEDSTKEFVSKEEGKSQFSLWHQRLGHPSSTLVTQVLKICNVQVLMSKSDSLCHACETWKSHKLPFSCSTTVYIVYLELIVANLWGSASCSSSGFHYYMTFVYAFFRYT